VFDTGEYATVYNLRVADFHTYFVGCQDWGFDVWAHNVYSTERIPDGEEARRLLVDELHVDPASAKPLLDLGAEENVNGSALIARMHRVLSRAGQVAESQPGAPGVNEVAGVLASSRSVAALRSRFAIVRSWGDWFQEWVGNRYLEVNMYLRGIGHMLQGYGWTLSWAAARLGIPLGELSKVDANGVARARITGARYLQQAGADMAILRGYMQGRGANQVVIRTGVVVTEDLRAMLREKAMMQDVYLGGTVTRAVLPADYGGTFESFEMRFPVNPGTGTGG
jgi:hypothetical protein